VAPSSSPPLVGYGLPLREPKLYDVLLAWKTQLLMNLHCVKQGQIMSYSYPTATVQILGQRVLKDGTTSPYPQLQNVPVFTIQGGGYSLQLPIASGDQCLVVFADRNIDNWYLNGNSQPPLDGRLHDMSDGFALVGINWKGSTAIPAPSSTEARLISQDGLTKIGIQTGKITVQNAAESLLTGLSDLTTAVKDLITVLNTLTTTGSATTQTISAATVAALVPVTAELVAVQAEFNALLY